MSIYSPNLKDPRVLKRIKHAYGYARGVFSEVKEQQKSIAALEKHFGKLSNPLSCYLFNTLLECTDQHYSEVAGISKKYRLIPAGVEKIRDVLKGKLEIILTPGEIKLLPPDPSARAIDELVVNAFVEREYGEQLKTLEFTYEDKSSRYWNELQNVRSEFRTKVFAKHGMKYNYDIRACAPTLLMQHAQQQNGVCFVEIEKLLKDRNAYRQFLADECEIGIKDAKTVINSLFCGAILGVSSRFALSKVLNYDVARIMCAKELTEVLRKDIKEMWSEIAPTMSRRKNKIDRLIPLQPRDKWARYFRLEREVIDAVQKYMKKTGNRYFLEHDGWTCEKMIDERELIAFVKKSTGYSIELDLEIFNDISGVATQQPTNESLFTLTSSYSQTDSFVSSSTKNTTNTETDCIYSPLSATPHVGYKSKDAINCNTDTRTWLKEHLKKCKDKSV